MTAAKYPDIANRLRWEIRNEPRYATPGARLPTMDELEEAFDAGRESVQRAVEILAEEGLVDVLHGKGLFVAGAAHTDSVNYRQLCTEIADLAMPGKPLPSVEDLARDWMMSESLVRQAIRQLIREGRLIRCPDGSLEGA